ncbi:MAG: GGDEF domain-containing protein [Gammaproteobacteria bacterium]|jgi:diguanylate cyclase
MASGNESASFDGSAVRKVLRMLEALRHTESGSVIYRQVERMLDEVVGGHRQLEQAYVDLIDLLLDAFCRQLPVGSPLQVQVKLLQARLEPPLTLSDLAALRSYVEVYGDQLRQVDSNLLEEAVAPLLQSFGISAEVQRGGRAPEPVAPVPPPAAVTAEPAEPEVPEAPSAEVASSAARPEQGVEATEAVQVPPASMPQAEPAPAPAEETVQAGAEAAKPRGDNKVASVYRTHLDAKQRDIQKLQATLAQQVLETITQNEEFGVLLEVVLSELRQAGEITELENLRWTLIREIEKLVHAHHSLADKLDSTHQYLQIIESDSRQLSDELTRVRLLSLTDELTGLPNRRAFLRRLEDEVARVQRYGFPLSLALIDLDKFKDVNDKYGHAGGDEVLRVYSRNVLSIFRHHDLVARYGGEEFAVLLPNTDNEGAVRALTKVKKRATETRWQYDGTVLPVPTFSAGLALYKPGETSSAFVDRADKALYRAKRLGRNRIELDMTYMPDAEPETREQRDADTSPKES